MERDVVRKLRLRPETTVVEIGCGVALLGVPVARRTARYVGLDFAPQAVEVARDRLRDAGLEHRARVECIDVLTAKRDELRALGRFDRLLMYAVFHYARDEAEAILFLQRTVDLLNPGGRALIGNVPLDDLQGAWTPPDPAPTGLGPRLVALTRWVMRPGGGAVPLSRSWKARSIMETMRKSRSSVEPFAPARLPPGYTLALSTPAIESWLRTLEGDVRYQWQLPAPGVPLAPGRADLILVRG